MSRLAVITGASRGLGFALANLLARRGWHLVITGRRPDALEGARQRLSGWTQVTAVPGDVTDPAHRAELATTIQTLGPLHALVNNAAILGPSPRPPLLALDWLELERLLRVNTVAPLALLQVLSPHMVPGGCILNVSSDAAPEAFAGWGGVRSDEGSPRPPDGDAGPGTSRMAGLFGRPGRHADGPVPGVLPG